MNKIVVGIVVIVLILAGWYWWQQGQGGEYVMESDEGGEVMNDVPVSLQDVIEMSCAEAGGYTGHVIEGMEAEGLGVVHNVAYVECADGEQEAYYLGEAQ